VPRSERETIAGLTVHILTAAESQGEPWNVEASALAFAVAAHADRCVPESDVGHISELQGEIVHVVERWLRLHGGRKADAN
jgi:hypothetical protein